MVNTGVVVRAAGLILAILVPPVVVIRALLGTESDSPLWYLIVVAFFVSFYVGGRFAGRAEPATAVKHGAVAGAVAFAAAVVVAVLRNLVVGRPMGLAALVTVLVFSQVAVSISALGGFRARRSAVRA